MTAVMENKAGILEGLERVPAHRRAWVNTLRQRGAEAFESRGFPTTRQEEWRDTNINPIAQTAFSPTSPAEPRAARDLAAKFTFGQQAAAELVFINGIYAPDLSRTDTQFDVRVLNFADAI